MERLKARGLLDRAANPGAHQEAPRVRSAIRALALAREPAAVSAARLELERARLELEERGELRPAAPLAAAALRDELRARPTELWLSYWIGEQPWLVLAEVGGDGTLVCEISCLGSREPCLEALRAAHAAVESPAGDPWPALDAAAGLFLPPALRARLWPGRRVVVSPDDIAARVPFEALRVEGEPLGIRCDVERAPSLSVRTRVLARAGAPAEGQVLVVDSVDLTGGDAALAPQPLSFSAREGELVAAQHERVQRLSGRAATFEALAAAAREPAVRVLHVSAHAVLGAGPLSSSLLLLADGAVPMSSLAALPLAGALVVLSACSSARGEQRGGEGEVSLLWGPIGAGARGVVASLWDVNQQATSDLMGQLHWHLRRGEGAAGALRATRARLAATSQYAHPHFWAGFAAYGDGPGAARRPAASWAAAAAGLGLGVVVLLWLVRRRATRRS
jgi:hypothetical protein